MPSANSLSLRGAEGRRKGSHMEMRPELQDSSSSHHQFGVAKFSVSPTTLAQGLAWENVAGSVSFRGDCQVQTSPTVGLGILVWGSLPNSTKVSCFMPTAPEL